MGLSVGLESHRHSPAACPRCGQPVREPTVWSSAWRCDWHGEVPPLRPAFSPSREGLDGLLRTPGVPVWLPWPLPAGWLVAGFAGAGDERTGTCACAVALSGPNPVGGPADMLVVAEAGPLERRRRDPAFQQLEIRQAAPAPPDSLTTQTGQAPAYRNRC